MKTCLISNANNVCILIILSLPDRHVILNIFYFVESACRRIFIQCFGPRGLVLGLEVPRGQLMQALALGVLSVGLGLEGPVLGLGLCIVCNLIIRCCITLLFEDIKLHATIKHLS